MFKMNRWTRSEKRSLCLGLTLAAAGACGAFQGLFDDALQADVKSRRQQRSEIRQAAGVDPAAQQLEERMEAAMDEASSNLDQFVKVRDAARSLGCPLTQPFMTLSFLSLSVIGDLKLTDRGLVDVAAFKHVAMFV